MNELIFEGSFIRYGNFLMKTTLVTRANGISWNEYPVYFKNIYVEKFMDLQSAVKFMKESP